MRGDALHQGDLQFLEVVGMADPWQSSPLGPGKQPEQQQDKKNA
jgi:hypothetical protein